MRQPRHERERLGIIVDVQPRRVRRKSALTAAIVRRQGLIGTILLEAGELANRRRAVGRRRHARQQQQSKKRLGEPEQEPS